MSNNQQRLQMIISQLREMRLTTMANQFHSLYLLEKNYEMTSLDYLEVIVNEAQAPVKIILPMLWSIMRLRTLSWDRTCSKSYKLILSGESLR